MEFSQELRTLATSADLVKMKVAENGPSASCSWKLWLITSPVVDVSVTSDGSWALGRLWPLNNDHKKNTRVSESLDIQSERKITFGWVSITSIIEHHWNGCFTLVVKKLFFLYCWGQSISYTIFRTHWMDKPWIWWARQRWKHINVSWKINAFTIEDPVCCGFVIYSFYYFEMCSFYACFLEGFFFFIINGCWIMSKALSASIEIIIWFLFFNLLMWCIKLIDLQILKNPCIPGINPTWSWFFWYVVGFCLLEFC